MILNLTPEHELLRDTVTRYLATDVSRPRLRAVIEADEPFPDEWLRQSADIGWFSALLDDDASRISNADLDRLSSAIKRARKEGA